MTDTITPESYAFSRYVNFRRWASYWHQIQEINEAGATSCLIIGKGDGIVPTILRQQGVFVTVCDLRPVLSPDLACDVRQLPFRTNAFQMVLCAQVLEHLPFACLEPTLAELSRVGNGRALVTLPDSSRYLELGLRLPRFGEKGIVLKWPRPARRIYSGHCWELSTSGFPAQDFYDAFTTHFRIVKEYNVPQNRYHRFFTLGPKAGQTAPRQQ